MFRFSFDNALKLATYGGARPACVINDADALAYYDALATANSGDIDAPAIYGISLCALKTAIDEAFRVLKLDGTYGQIGNLAIPIGGTVATHNVDMITATSILSQVGAPTNGAAGVTLNGTSQYILTSVSPGGVGALSGLNDNHIMNFSSGATHIAMGCTDNSAAEQLYGFVGSPSLAGEETFYSTSSVANENVQGLTVDENKVLIYSRTAIDRVDLYEDGVSVGNSVVANTGVVLPDVAHVYGGVNFEGSAVVFNSDGDFIGGSLGLGLTAAQALTLTNVVKTLNAALGR